VEVDVFAEQRVELIEGVVVEMSPMGRKHEVGVLLVVEALRQAFGPGYIVRPQLTLDLSPHSMPEPDALVVPGEARDYLEAQPTSGLLLVEVSDTTLSYDRTTKASLYAKMGIADYLIVNLNKQRVEVYRDPVEDQRAKYGYHYQTILNLGAVDLIVPLALPGVSIAVGDLLL